MNDKDEYGLSAEQKRTWREYNLSQKGGILADALVTVLAQLMKRNAQLTTYKTWVGVGKPPAWLNKTDADWRKAAEAWLREK